MYRVAVVVSLAIAAVFRGVLIYKLLKYQQEKLSKDSFRETTEDALF